MAKYGFQPPNPTIPGIAKRFAHVNISSPVSTSTMAYSPVPKVSNQQSYFPVPSPSIATGTGYVPIPSSQITTVSTSVNSTTNIHVPTSTVNKDINRKQFAFEHHYPLTKIAYTQQWYNRLGSLGHFAGIYITPWEAVIKGYHMGATWNATFIDKAILDPDRHQLMSSTLHHFPPHKDLFTGECEHYHMLSATTKDGYQLLYEILRTIHPALGKNRVQPLHT